MNAALRKLNKEFSAIHPDQPKPKHNQIWPLLMALTWQRYVISIVVALRPVHFVAVQIVLPLSIAPSYADHLHAAIEEHLNSMLLK